ncbi:MAG: ThuA domain-containing protein [Planctomycetes bacterium]|nr:ThuA domain-containing protein [Planctomycetota bacterium]
MPRSRSSLAWLAALSLSAALPAQGAKPDPLPARVLFVTHTAGFEHEVVRRGPAGELAHAEQLLPVVLGPAWSVESTKDCARLNAAELARTRVVVFHTTGELPLREEDRRAFFDWIDGGGGFVGLHCATDTLYKCEEYMQLVGAAFDGHPWHQWVRVRALEPAGTAGPVAFLAGATISLHDEIYQFRAQPTGVRESLELDMSSVDATRGKHARNLIAWWKPVGRGRMVYNALGHGREAWDDPVFHDLVREAVRFAGGTQAPPAVDAHLFASAQGAFFALAALSRGDQGRLWGAALGGTAEAERAALLDGPLLVVDPRSRVVLANRSDAQAGLEPLVPGVWISRLPAQMPLANTALTWGGTLWSMLMAPLPEDARARDTLIVHESFHRLQGQQGLSYGDALCAHLDAADARIWLRLEMRALAVALDALAAEPARDADATWRQALLDALLFRAVRRDAHAQAAQLENALELHEGLAEYTGLRIAHAQPAAAAAAALRARETGDGFVRGFAYATGPAYGLLLDRGGADWRAAALLGESLTRLAYQRNALQLPEQPDARTTLAAQRKLIYGGAEVEQAEQQREALRVARENADRARYLDRARIELPAGPRSSYSFDPNAVRPLAQAGTIFEPVSVSDDWGALTAPGGALRAGAPAPGPGETWIVPVPEPAPDTAELSGRIEGPGYTLELAPGWQLIPRTPATTSPFPTWHPQRTP